MNDDKYLLSSVSNALAILDLLSTREMMSLAEISKELGFGKTSAFRLLYTLEAKGFVVKSENARYMLSRKFTYYGEIVSERNDNFSLARPKLKALSDKVGETVHMSMLTSNFNVIFVEKINGGYNLQSKLRLGFEQPAYCSGTGKVLMSALLGTPFEEELKKIVFKPRTKSTISNFADLKKELQKIKEQGYGEDREESEIGLSCISVPVFNSDGSYHLAISIAGATRRVNENFDRYLPELRKTANEISGLLGL